MLITLTQVEDLDLELLDKKIDQMMPELGFTQEDNDRLVASYSGGWQMRMCLGKMLLQEPDLLLLDEPTNHLDLDAIQVCAVGCIGPGADTIRVHAALSTNLSQAHCTGYKGVGSLIAFSHAAYTSPMR